MARDGANVRNCTWCHGTSAQGYVVTPRLAGQRAGLSRRPDAQLSAERVPQRDDLAGPVVYARTGLLLHGAPSHRYWRSYEDTYVGQCKYLDRQYGVLEQLVSLCFDLFLI